MSRRDICLSLVPSLFQGLTSVLCFLLKHKKSSRSDLGRAGQGSMLPAWVCGLKQAGDQESRYRFKVRRQYHPYNSFRAGPKRGGSRAFSVLLENDIGGEGLGRKPSALLFTLTLCRRKSISFGVTQTCVCVQILALSLTNCITLSSLNLNFLICKMGHIIPGLCCTRVMCWVKCLLYCD